MNPSRPAQVNKTGDEYALLLKQFAGEVLTTFEDENITGGKIFTRRLSSGRSAQFPLVGKVGAQYFTPGGELAGQTVGHAETTIEIDGLLLSDVFIDDLDEVMNHYDVRSPYTMEMGRVLAKTYDENNLRSIIQSARSSAPLPDHNGGSTITNAALESDAGVLRDAIFQAAQKFDEKNVPGTRYMGLRPSEYYLLANQTDLMNKDWGGRGNYAEADLPVVAGLKIVKCNHIPGADDSLNNDIKAKYRADYSNVVALAWTNWAAGVVSLKDLTMESDWLIKHQGHLLVAKYAVGHGKLRADCAIEMTRA